MKEGSNNFAPTFPFRRSRVHKPSISVSSCAHKLFQIGRFHDFFLARQNHPHTFTDVGAELGTRAAGHAHVNRHAPGREGNKLSTRGAEEQIVKYAYRLYRSFLSGAVCKKKKKNGAMPAFLNACGSPNQPILGRLPKRKSGDMAGNISFRESREVIHSKPH